MIEISIIVTVYNASKTLSDCLDSLMKLDFPIDNREIIVVDNNSTDNSKDIIHRYPVKYVFEPIKGRGRARNTGIKASCDKYIAFTDSDCVVDKSWLKQLIKGFDSKDIAACGGRIIAFKTDNWLERYAESRQLLGQQKAIVCEISRDVPRVVTANAIFRRDILEKLGNFDEDLITSEDTEIGWRIAFRGLGLKYVSSAIVYHKHISRFWHYCLHQVDFGLAAYIFMKKYGFQQENLFCKIKHLLLLTIKLFFVPFRLIVTIITNWSDHKIFLFLDAVTRLFFVWGQLRLVVQDIIFPRTIHFTLRDDLNNLQSNVRISHNSQTWLLRKKVIWFINEGVINFLNFNNSSFYSLNQGATKIWQELLSSKEVSLATDLISRQSSAAKEVVLKDIIDLMHQLEKESLLIRGRL